MDQFCHGHDVAEMIGCAACDTCLLESFKTVQRDWQRYVGYCVTFSQLGLLIHIGFDLDMVMPVSKMVTLVQAVLVDHSFFIKRDNGLYVLLYQLLSMLHFFASRILLLREKGTSCRLTRQGLIRRSGHSFSNFRGFHLGLL